MKNPFSIFGIFLLDLFVLHVATTALFCLACFVLKIEIDQHMAGEIVGGSILIDLLYAFFYLRNERGR